MNTDKLSKRLFSVAQLVKNDARVADIGSDHAYLLTYLVKNGVINYAIAGEVVEGPFQSAKNEISKQEMTDKIFPRLGDGLSVIKTIDEIDTVTICGMGGKLIRQILAENLNAEHFNHLPALILQPNNSEALLRQWLISNQYEIIHEEVITENAKFYEVFLAVPTEIAPEWTAEEIQFGRYTFINSPESFVQKWKSIQSRHESVLKNLKNAQYKEVGSKVEQFETEIAKIQKKLAEVPDA